VEVHTRGKPLLTFTLRGTLYSKGTRSKVAFDNVPKVAKRTVENQPSIPPASAWSSTYTITVSAHDAGTTTYHLVPIGNDPTTSAIEATVDNTTGLASTFVWTRKNGMTITSTQTYAKVGKFMLPASTSTQTRGGGPASDSETTFSDYHLGADVPDSVFEG